MTDDAHSLPILEPGERDETTVGNYFVANYPPFSFWRAEGVPAVSRLLAEPAPAALSLGLYVHIPFCRKRCDFCYFRVYTDKTSSEIRRYSSALLREVELYASRPYVRGRRLAFVYFGGGTPSYLSVEQLTELFEGLRERIPWDGAPEVAFECEPGTLQPAKIRALRDLGVTRLSLGIESFDPEILALNNRAHRAKEIVRAWETIRDAGFPQVNVDLIAGMVGETDERWRATVEKTIALAPESVTIYQMEIPYNTTIWQRMQGGGTRVAPVADWATKRRWLDEAFAALERAGYSIGSAYTAVRSPDTRFVYRDALWSGADMLGTGVASFSHLRGVHFQNEHDFDPYIERLERGELPIVRALEMTADERLVREFILRLKLGHLDGSAFERKFGVDVVKRFAGPLRAHESAGLLRVEGKRIVLTRAGLLQVDRILHDFFLDEHRGARYA